MLVIGAVVVVVRGEELREELEEIVVTEDDNDTGLDSGLLASPATREDRRFRLERSSEVGVAVVDEALGCSKTGVVTLLDGALRLVHEEVPPFCFICSRESAVGLTRGIEFESLPLAELGIVEVLMVPEEELLLYELTRAFGRGRFWAMV